jgi:hypothetical protein
MLRFKGVTAWAEKISRRNKRNGCRAKVSYRYIKKVPDLSIGDLGINMAATYSPGVNQYHRP